jgi:hypothetical protein
MRAQSIHQHRALANQTLATTMQQQSRLLLGRLGRNEAHRWPLNRLANRFRVRRVVLVALHIGLDVLRRHQPHLVAERLQLPRPVMRRCTRFQSHHARR